jgi:hypothetical protein
MKPRKRLNHLKEQNETYFEHLVNAQKIAFLLLFMSIGCFIHSFIPNVLTNIVSSRLDKLKKITLRNS